MPIKLSPEAVERLLASIKRFAAESLDEDVGDLKARLVLDFVLREIGPSIYNQAIADAQKYFQERTVDLDSACFQPEFTYWTAKSK